MKNRETTTGAVEARSEKPAIELHVPEQPVVYEKPAIEIIEMETEGILCGSYPDGGGFPGW
jgi:hypothetical protein